MLQIAIRSALGLAFLIPGITRATEDTKPQETLPPLTADQVPADFKSLWAGFDPRAEPLDVEVLAEWEKEGVVIKVLRYRVGVFKGRKAMVAGVYGHPKGARNIPGLINIHGGGQYADANAVFTNAKRGYATLSIAWAGRISAENYRVGPAEVKLFWEGKTEAPNYRITTDWGALDAYHAPSRHGKDAFVSVPSYDWSLDQVPSPRNNSWFLCILAARRGLTFLEQQDVVDGNRLGAYGHSMGGKQTVLTAATDERIKVAVPSCGGISDRWNADPLHRNAVGDGANLPHVRCPILFLKPANDFHSRIDDLPTAIKEIQSGDWRVVISPHHNHQDTPPYEVATQLWFDQHLKAGKPMPTTPLTELSFKEGVPVLSIKADTSRPIRSVDVYYTRLGKSLGKPGDRDEMANTKTRYWRHSKASGRGDSWRAELPVFETDSPLWLFANVTYSLPEPVSGAGYYYRTYTADEFVVSSMLDILSPDQLKQAGLRPTLTETTVIEDFSDGWEGEWFNYRPERFSLSTHKLRDSRLVHGPATPLMLSFTAESDHPLVVVLNDTLAAEVSVEAGKPQTKVLNPADFEDAEGTALKEWPEIRILELTDHKNLRLSDNKGVRRIGTPWKGDRPAFHELRWREKE